MKKVINEKNGQVAVVFETFTIGESNVCPQCKRAFKERDIQAIADRKQISCPKCGSKLKRQ